MFTIKYRSWEPCNQQPANGPTFFQMVERIDGPFTCVSQHYEEGDLLAVTGHRGEHEPGMTYGPWLTPAPSVESSPDWPRPTLWVMNESGATVASYNL